MDHPERQPQSDSLHGFNRNWLPDEVPCRSLAEAYRLLTQRARDGHFFDQ